LCGDRFGESRFQRIADHQKPARRHTVAPQDRFIRGCGLLADDLDVHDGLEQDGLGLHDGVLERVLSGGAERDLLAVDGVVFAVVDDDLDVLEGVAGEDALL